MARDIVSRYRLEADDRTKGAFRSVNGAVDRARNTVARYGAAIAAVAGPTALALLTRRSFESIDATAKFADRVGIATDALAGLRAVAEDTGNTGQNLNLGLQRMTRRVAEAAQGMGEAQSALRTLGLDAEALTRLPVEQQFQQIAQAMQGVEGRAEQVRLAFKLFDSEGVGLLNTLDAIATDGLAGVTDELRILGTAVSRVDAAQIEAANDAMARARRVTEGLGNSVAIAVAPAVTQLATEFADAAVEAGGFENIARTGVEAVARVVGILGNSIRVLKIGWSGLEVAAAVTTVAVGETLAQLLESVNIVARGWNLLINELIAKINELAGLDIPQLNTDPLRGPIEEVRGVVVSAQSTVMDLSQELQDLATTEWPSEYVSRFMEEVSQASREAAEEVAAARAEIGGGDAGVDPEVAERAREAAEQRLAQLEQFLGDETRAIDLAFEQRREAAQEAFEQNLITEEERNALLLEIEERHQKALTDAALAGLSARERFAKMSWSRQVQTVAGALVEMTQGVATHSRTMFEINKAASIAQAVVNTAQGVTRALAEYPPPISFVMAAAQAAAGLAQINAIKSTQFGSGTTPSVNGSVPTLNGQPVGGGGGVGAGGDATGGQLGDGDDRRGGPGRVTINLDDDDLLDGAGVRRLLERINTEIGNGAEIRVGHRAASLGGG